MLEYYDKLAVAMNLPTSAEYVKCSYCEEPVAPADVILSEELADEGFCSYGCRQNWLNLLVRYEEVDYE